MSARRGGPTGSAPAGSDAGVASPPPPPPTGSTHPRAAASSLESPPKPEEWSQVGEVTVKGSTALNCETKVVRDWLRVTVARFSWSNGSHPLVVDYPRGGPRPAIVGTFVGAKSPLDDLRATAEYVPFVCRCRRTSGSANDAAAAPCSAHDVDALCAYSWLGKCARSCRSHADCAGGHCVDYGSLGAPTLVCDYDM